MPNNSAQGGGLIQVASTKNWYRNVINPYLQSISVASAAEFGLILAVCRRECRTSVTIEILQLRYALMSADLRSFSGAAAKLNVKQATLSRSVLQLEDRLGIKLFERTTRGAEPTETGKVFLETARRIITDLENLQTTARAVSYGEQGRFAVGYCSSLMGMRSMRSRRIGKTSASSAGPN